MSFYIEVYYSAPADRMRENRISAVAAHFGGQLTFREEPTCDASSAICLTYEFGDASTASDAALQIQRMGEHVEGPADYGDN